MQKEQKPFVEIYADGACSGNPGVGGFGAILRSGKKEKEISGCDKMTTNNRMELLAVISALEVLKKPCKVAVTTDSNYVVKGMTEWIQGWIKNKWRTSQKKEVMNRDLWERLLKASSGHEIEWKWIKGHNGHPENERCDKLAQNAIKNCQTIRKQRVDDRRQTEG
ncbi:ribonuclease H [Dissulfurispira thermophila]|uniref:Ribonuclease H n=2 Tax=root TaxID=1 RepID=A0A7G1GXQ3_9BACT|nr:ribonuclease HI [Dissulfurispira thermophila]BCB95100.1 ribonuclease H [Dissulfurispira thermophila]